MFLPVNGLRQARLVAASALVLAYAGCGQRDEIAKYTALKPEVVDPTLVARQAPSPSAAPATEQQTIGLIVPVGQTGWFFKLTGDAKAVEPQHQNFIEFATTIDFGDGPDPKPKWQLPEGWKEIPGSQMRFATIQIEAEGKPLDLSVIPLPMSGGDYEQYVLDNVNRWRNQLSLKPISTEELKASTKTLKIDGHEATLVSLVGKGSGGMSSMGGAPFAPFAGGQLPPDHPPIGDAKAPK